MDLNATFRTLVALLKVLDDAALTEGVEALGDGGGFDQVTPAHGAGDVAIKVPDQVPPLARHLQQKVRGQGSKTSAGSPWRQQRVAGPRQSPHPARARRDRGLLKSAA